MSKYIATGLLVLACLASSACHRSTSVEEDIAAQAKEMSKNSVSIPMDAPVETDIGYGIVLRVPAGFLMPRPTSPDVLNKRFKSDIIRFIFWYPDMRMVQEQMAGWQYTEAGRPSPKENEFTVRVSDVFYSPDAQAELPSDKATVHFLRPHRGLQNFLNTLGGGKIIESNYPNLDEVIFKDPDSKYIVEHAYIQKDGDGYYEILITCGGLNCNATVFSRKYHMQYSIP
jgi:hypothetical protein